MNQRQKLEKMLEGRIKGKERLLKVIEETEQLKADSIKRIDELKTEQVTKCNALILKAKNEIDAHDKLIAEIKKDLGISEDIQP